MCIKTEILAGDNGYIIVIKKDVCEFEYVADLLTLILKSERFTYINKCIECTTGLDDRYMRHSTYTLIHIVTALCKLLSHSLNSVLRSVKCLNAGLLRYRVGIGCLMALDASDSLCYPILCPPDAKSWEKMLGKTEGRRRRDDRG